MTHLPETNGVNFIGTALVQHADRNIEREYRVSKNPPLPAIVTQAKYMLRPVFGWTIMALAIAWS